MNKPHFFSVSYIHVEPYKGALKSSVEKEAQEISNELGCIVLYEFNGLKYAVGPDEK